MSAPRLINPPPTSGGVPVGGSGTVGTLPIWVGASTLGNSAVTQVSGSIFSLTGLVGGTGYAITPSFAFVGGSGTGARGAISQVSSTAIAWVQLLDPGSGYVAGDVLTIPGGVGGSITVLAVVPKNDAAGHLTAQRIGAGTTQPNAGIDSRFGAWLRGFQRNPMYAITLASGANYDASPTILSIGEASTPMSVDALNSTNMYGVRVFMHATTSVPSTPPNLLVFSARAENQASSGSSFYQILGFQSTLFRSQLTDQATGGSHIGISSSLGIQGLPATYTQDTVYNYNATQFVNTDCQSTTNLMTIFRFGGLSGNGRYALTRFTFLDQGPRTDAAGSTCTTFYGVRLQPVLMVTTNRYHFAQEDVTGRSHLRAKVFVGSSVGAAQQTAASVEVEATNTILTGTITNAGAAYTDGTYNNQLFTGGAPTVQARGNFVVSGGVVTSVALISGGEGYAVGNVLSCALPGGAGFQWTVATVQGNGDVRLRSTSAVFDASNSSTNGVRFFARTTGDLPTTTTQNYYEQGTYTPTLVNFTMNSPAVATGSWVRIGNRVMVTVNFASNGVATFGNLANASISLPLGVGGSAGNFPITNGNGIRCKDDGTALGNGVLAVVAATGVMFMAGAGAVDAIPKIYSCSYTIP